MRDRLAVLLVWICLLPSLLLCDGNGPPPPAVLLHLSDLHISAIEDPARLTDLFAMSDELLPGLAPHAVMISGDLVHSKVVPGEAPVGRQVEAEWQVRRGLPVPVTRHRPCYPRQLAQELVVGVRSRPAAAAASSEFRRQPPLVTGETPPTLVVPTSGSSSAPVACPSVIPIVRCRAMEWWVAVAPAQCVRSTAVLPVFGMYS